MPEPKQRRTLRIVFDVNVLVSALITRGKSRELWRRGVRREFELISSEQIHADLIRVTSRGKFKPYVKRRDIQDFSVTLHAKASFVNVKSSFSVVKEDPDDDIILRTAFDGKARYVVSGDKHLLALGRFKGIKTVTVDEMLKILKRKSSGR